MRTNLIFFTAALLTMCMTVCCKHKNNSQPTLSLSVIGRLLQESENANSKLEARISAALKADSMALQQGNEKFHITCQRAIGVLYLKQKNNALAQKCFLQTVALAKPRRAYEDIAIALSGLGHICNERSEYDSAVKYYLEANDLFKKTGQTKLIAQNLVNIAVAYKNEGDFGRSLAVNFEAIRLLDSQGLHQDLGYAFISAGNNLKEVGRFDEALEYTEKALMLMETEGDSSGMAMALNTLGNLHRMKKEYKVALIQYLRSLKIKEAQRFFKAMAVTLNNIGSIYSDLKEWDNAENHFRRALKIRDSLNDKDGILTTSNYLAKTYLQKGKIKEAELTALNAHKISTGTNMLRQRLENEQVLSQIYEALSKDRLALRHIQKAIELKDSLFNADMAKTMSEMQTKYKTEQTQKDLAYSIQLQNVQTTKINTQKHLILILGVSLLFISSLVYLVYLSNKKLKLSNERVEALIREVNHRTKNNLQIISDMLSLQIYATDDKDQQTSLQTCKNRVESMNILHSMLYKREYNGMIGMKAFIEELVSNLTFSYQDKSTGFEVEVNVENIMLSVHVAIPLGLIANELITNIYKYAQEVDTTPWLKIEFSSVEGRYHFQVTDNCRSWDIETHRAQKKGLGLVIVDTLVSQLNGIWKCEPLNDKYGTIHSIEF